MRFVIAVMVASATAFAGGGRVPATTRIEFRQGHPSDIAVGTTFGMLFSHDAGATWRWMCPAAAHYSGTFDPDLAYTASGAVVVTSFDGVAAMRDTCTFGPTPLLSKFASQLELDPQGDLTVAIADPTQSAIARSSDGALTFPQTTSIGVNNDYWRSLLVSGDGQRIYVSGMHALELDDSILLLESHDGGATFAPMAGMNLATGPNYTIDLVGLDPTAPTRLYARVNNPQLGFYAIYRSDDTGATWTQIDGVSDPQGPPSLLVRSDGSLVRGVMAGGDGVKTSSDHGATWQTHACQLHIGCLAEAPDGEIWACTQNFDFGELAGDGFALMHSHDLDAWSAVMQLHDIQGPVACAPGTIQRDQCELAWADIYPQLFPISSRPACVMSPPDGPPMIDAAIGGDASPAHHEPAGCCSADGGHENAISFLVVLCVFARRRHNHEV